MRKLVFLDESGTNINPIELLLSKVKAILRKMKKRTADALAAAIEQAMKQITPEDCRGWFHKAGYYCWLLLLISCTAI